ncbi:MAG TPA: peptidase S8, partial [Pilimelia sp.]|nr:peptidase S8 [Pilimelia sp.]
MPAPVPVPPPLPVAPPWVTPAPVWPAPPAYPPPPAPAGTGGGAGAIVAAVALGVWAVGLTVVVQGLGWLVDQILLASGFTTPPWLWPLAAVVNALLVAVPAALLAIVPRSPAVRSAGRAWLLGAIALGGFGLLRAIPVLHHEAYLASLALLATIGAIVLRARARRRVTDPAGEADATASGDAMRAARASAGAMGIAAGLWVLVPWLWFGAAGGLTETALALLAAAAVGWFAAGVLDAGFWAPYAAPRAPAARPSRVRLVLLGGLVSGVALLLLGAGTGAGGPHLAALVILPALGFAAAALRAMAPGTSRGALLALVGLVALGPLALVDPEEVTLLLIGRDVPFWALVATGASVVAALAAGGAYAIVAGRRAAPPRVIAFGAALLLLLVTGAVYVGLGQPGLHGDRLFVVLRDQADLSGVATVAANGQAGRDARVRAVYQRLVEHAQRTQAELRRELDRLRLDYRPYY